MSPARHRPIRTKIWPAVVRFGHPWPFQSVIAYGMELQAPDLKANYRLLGYAV